MEQLIIGILFITALAIIINRVRKLFDQDCGDCSQDCSCCQSGVPQPREIKIDSRGR